MEACNRTKSEILRFIAEDKGMHYLSKNISLTENFIQENADQMDSVLWRNMVLNQSHINPEFFDRFFPEMDEITKSMLLRKKIMFRLIKVLKRM